MINIVKSTGKMSLFAENNLITKINSTSPTHIEIVNAHKQGK